MMPFLKKDLIPAELECIKLARVQRPSAYAPYSRYKVGAALIEGDSKSFRYSVGMNIENSSLGDTVCAERVAIFNFISKHKFISKKEKYVLAFVTASEKNKMVTPCGSCLQVLLEFFDEEGMLNIIHFNENDADTYWKYTLHDCLPMTSGVHFEVSDIT